MEVTDMTPTEPIISFEHYKDRVQKAKTERPRRARQNDKSRRAQNAYDPRSERPTGHTLHFLDVNSIKEKITATCDKLAIASETSMNDEEVNAFRATISEYRKGPPMSTITFAVVGEQGIGKSTSINALLHRDRLADAQQSIEACTQHATRYEYKSGAPVDSDESDFTIVFLDAAELETIITEHIRNWAYCHMPENTRVPEHDEELSQDDDDTEEKVLTERENRLATTAMEFFQDIFSTRANPQGQKELDDLLNPQSIQRGDLLRQCQARIEDIKRELGATENRIVHPNVKDKDISSIRDFVKSIWTIVDIVVVATGAAILESGVSIIDLPGFGDLNQSRTALANSVRRKADYEIVVAPLGRIKTREDVDHYIRNSIKAHGVSKTVLLLNQIDRFIARDPETVEKVINNTPEPPFVEIKHLLAENDHRVAESEDEDEEDLIYEYGEHLRKQAAQAYLHLEVQKTAEDLKERHGKDLKVCGISADNYILHMRGHTMPPPALSAPMTGVPNYRNILGNIAAEKTYQNLHKFVFRTLPSLGIKGRRIVKKEMGDPEYVRLREDLKKLFQIFQEEQKSLISNSLETLIPTMWQNNVRRAVLVNIERVIQRWGRDARWNTFYMTIRQYGIPLKSQAYAYRGKQINWNNDLLNAMENLNNKRPLESWKDGVLKELKKIYSGCKPVIVEFCARMRKRIDGASCPLQLKKRTLKAWCYTEQEVWRTFNNLPRKIRTVVLGQLREISTEEDIGCMIAKLNTETYIRISQVLRKRGVHRLQQEEMRSALIEPDENGKTFVDRYEDQAVQKMKDGLSLNLGLFREKLTTHVQNFLATTAQFLVNEGYQTEEHRKLRDRLEAALPEFDHGLLQIQRMFPGCEDQEEVRSFRAAKRVKKELEDRN